jgi:hypothetical protein
MVGELYYAVAKNNPGLAFPAGVCPTIGVGGHFRGGGIGMIMRKYGLSIDNVVDSKLIDPKGDLLDWANMGEDLFWAIRGGGGGSFGIVVSWKVTLVKVPPTVTVITTVRTVDQGAIGIVTKWQSVAPYLPNDITMRVIVQGQQAVFQSVNLGTCDEILPTLASRFQELGTTRDDCSEMTWLESTVSGSIDTEALLNRTTSLSTTFFTKKESDYVRRAIPKGAWKSIFFDWFTMDGAGLIILEPHGGFISTVPAGETPYTHRSGVLYNIQYIVFWRSGGDDGSTGRNWISDFMGST